MAGGAVSTCFDAGLLFAANQESGCISVLTRDGESGRLKLTARKIACNAPVCLVAVDM